jgi:hypothetical protein
VNIKKVFFVVCLLSSSLILGADETPAKETSSTSATAKQTSSKKSTIKYEPAGSRVLTEKDAIPQFQDPASKWAYEESVTQDNILFKQLQVLRTQAEQDRKIIIALSKRVEALEKESGKNPEVSTTASTSSIAAALPTTPKVKPYDQTVVKLDSAVTYTNMSNSAAILVSSLAQAQITKSES